MTKFLKTAAVLFVTSSIILSGCSNSPKAEAKNPETIVSEEPLQEQRKEIKLETAPARNNADAASQSEPSKLLDKPVIDLSKVKPNEGGKVMVVMFHNFITTYKSGDKEYTTTFEDFRKLLPDLYEKGYRLVNLNDYINNNILVPAGYLPMVFTFDDGTSGQFNLVEENGELVANRDSAVGILEEFNERHPDFGLKGTFFVNLGGGTFEGKGTLADRLKYLTDKGFEIGNHTYNHIDLKQVTSSDKVQREIGENQKKMQELIPGYKMKSLALPLGNTTKEDIRSFVAKGEFESVAYENLAILEVGWDPNFSPVSKSFNPLSVHRVRASGIKPVEADLEWWLSQLSRNEQYISDGDPDIVTVPKGKEANVDPGRLEDKKLVTY